MLASAFALASLPALLTGCPEKGGPADKTSAEPEPEGPDDEGQIDDDGKPKKPASAASAAPADDKKADDGKEEGGW